MRKAALLLALLAAGCRDGPPPFGVGDSRLPPDGGVRRLTYNPGPDRAPVWAPGGDSIYYSAAGFGRLPATGGLLLAVPREGGTVRALLPSVQVTGLDPRYLVAPALSPDGRRLAFADLEELWGPAPCRGEPACSSETETAGDSALGRVVLRVRRLDGTGPLGADPALPLEFDRPYLDRSQHPAGLEGVWIYRYPRFQVEFASRRRSFFRPSWAPDGQRLAFSDGGRILLWTIGQPGARPVPGGEGGISPAWSPDGSAIAFTRLETADSSVALCIYADRSGPACAQRRIVYRLARSLLTLVSPDGSALRVLGEGWDPAWAPDGRTLYFRRGDSIWRSAADGTGAAPVPGTEAGVEPAVSPDARWLAFSRLSPLGYDLWVVSLDSQR